jgi:hypothetical protein
MFVPTKANQFLQYMNQYTFVPIIKNYIITYSNHQYQNHKS